MWTNLMKNGTKTKNVDRCVFQWIHSKTHHQLPNFVLNSEGKILFDPKEAISEVHSVWDSVFSVNAGFPDPSSILAEIWPVVEPVRLPTNLPDLCGKDLKDQVQKRNIRAAPGLDGWRTIEAQFLPIQFYAALSSFFVDIEKGNRNAPLRMSQVKQVLLPKPGSKPGDPLSKRIIALLSVFIVSYTSLRFKQLCYWQNAIFPPELCGGIKGRVLSTIPVQMRLDIDHASSAGKTLLGVKIDKSKAFDRIVPAVAALLMLAFGVERSLVNFFTQLYPRLERYTCIGPWCSSLPLRTTNGLVQGCSPSLLSMNLQMSVWVLVLKRLEVLSIRSFVDDAYIWCDLIHRDQLQEALRLTSVWDEMTGMATNTKKCQSWSNTTGGRKLVQSLFPEMDFVHTVDVLGTKLYTTKRLSYDWDPVKTQKIIQDATFINCLPCKREVREHILATKVISQLHFISQVSSIPVKALQDIQSAIAKTLWRNRPKWRSKHLLLGILAKPHRSDPFVARAYRTILDTTIFLKGTTANNRQTWKEQSLAASVQPNSLVAHFKQACAILGLAVVDGFFLSILDNCVVSLLDFDKRELKCLLEQLCRNACYRDAAKSKRKDIATTCGFLDFSRTIAFYKQTSESFEGLKISSLLDSAFTGCHTTNDRLHASELVDSDTCRFCGRERETIHHIANSCDSLDCSIPKPACPKCGPNFKCLGLVEVLLARFLAAFLVVILQTHPVLSGTYLCHSDNTFGQMAVCSFRITFGGSLVVSPSLIRVGALLILGRCTILHCPVIQLNFSVLLVVLQKVVGLFTFILIACHLLNSYAI